MGTSIDSSDSSIIATGDNAGELSPQLSDENCTKMDNFHRNQWNSDSLSSHTSSGSIPVHRSSSEGVNNEKVAHNSNSTSILDTVIPARPPKLSIPLDGDNNKRYQNFHYNINNNNDTNSHELLRNGLSGFATYDRPPIPRYSEGQKPNVRKISSHQVEMKSNNNSLEVKEVKMFNSLPRHAHIGREGKQLTVKGGRSLEGNLDELSSPATPAITYQNAKTVPTAANEPFNDARSYENLSNDRVLSQNSNLSDSGKRNISEKEKKKPFHLDCFVGTKAFNVILSFKTDLHCEFRKSAIL